MKSIIVVDQRVALVWGTTGIREKAGSQPHVNNTVVTNVIPLHTPEWSESFLYQHRSEQAVMDLSRDSPTNHTSKVDTIDGLYILQTHRGGYQAFVQPCLAPACAASPSFH